MTSKRPHDQRFWETDEWECGWIEMTQMLLLYISAHLVCCVFKERTSTWVFVPWFSCMCVSGGWSPYLVCLCLPLYLIVWVLYFLMYLYPSRPVERLLAALCVWVCARVCVCVCACVFVCVVWMLVVQSTPLCQILSLVFSLMFWWQ